MERSSSCIAIASNVVAARKGRSATGASGPAFIAMRSAARGSTPCAKRTMAATTPIVERSREGCPDDPRSGCPLHVHAAALSRPIARSDPGIAAVTTVPGDAMAMGCSSGSRAKPAGFIARRSFAQRVYRSIVRPMEQSMFRLSTTSYDVRTRNPSSRKRRPRT